MKTWPTSPRQLIRQQEKLRDQSPDIWRSTAEPIVIGACFMCCGPGSTKAGTNADVGWAGAVLFRGRKTLVETSVKGLAGAPYRPGLLALREGPLLEKAVNALPRLPDVLLVNATGRDHPRRAGLALQLGALLDVPTIGVTNRVLLARGNQPGAEYGSNAPFMIEREVVGAWLRTRAGAHPVAVHVAWRTDLNYALQLVLDASNRYRTPEPLRRARCMARTARSHDLGRTLSPR